LKILVIGSGGREHALIWKLAASPRRPVLYCAPGNAGTADLATNVPISAGDLDELLAFALREQIDLTVVGPDDTLAAGCVDRFEAAGLRIFGPCQQAARLESSKIFAKDFMLRHGIPTARAGSFDHPADAIRFLDTVAFPVVIKADGLALGKGVVICANRDEAVGAIRSMMEAKIFGAAGSRILIEEYLEGVECSIHALIDGEHALLFPVARDHKRVGENDIGPNTGGMGTVSPPPEATPGLIDRVRHEVIDPFLRGIAADAIPFRGMLFPGLMLTADGLRVLEFNCRFGDPETQVLMTRLRTDLIDLIEATLDGRLDQVRPDWDSRTAVCVIMASPGYPGSYPKGLSIRGTEDAAAQPGVAVFHAGTARAGTGLVTSGGRVLGVTGLGDSVEAARAAAYAAVDRISFDGAHYRRDIGATPTSI